MITSEGLAPVCGGSTVLHWSEVTVVPPPCEPVSLTQVKNRIRVAHSGDDADLQLLIAAARRQVEFDTSAVLVAATLEQTVDAPPEGASLIQLTRWPVRSIVSVTSVAQDGTPTVLDPSLYRLDSASRPARVYLTVSTGGRLYDAVTIRYLAGFAEDWAPVQDLSWAGSVITLQLQGNAPFLAGDRVSLRGVDQDFYNNTFTVTSGSGNTYTLLAPLPPGWPDPVSPASGGAMGAIELGTPETLQLAVLALVQHWYDPLRRGLTASPDTRAGEVPLPFGYETLTADRLEWLT